MVGGEPTCAFRDTPMSAAAVTEVSIASVCLVNYNRVRAGLQPVWIDPRLASAAEGHARDQAARNFFDHVNPDGCNPSCRALAVGYPLGAGENIYAGIATATTAVDGWLRSPGHRSNILNPSYRTIGSGTAVGGESGRQWVHTFGSVSAPITAVSGLEPGFQGAAFPGRESPVTGDRAPARGSRMRSRLRVRSARITRAWRLQLTATITSRANGGRLRVRVRARGRTVTFRIRIAGGRARLNRKLPARVRARRMLVTIHYAGTSRVHPGGVRLPFS